MWQRFVQVRPCVAGVVPRVLFVTGPFAPERLPPAIADNFSAMLAISPGYVLRYFDDDAQRRFMQSSLNAEDFASYDALVAGAFRADAFRYVILERYGGVYADVGHLALVPLDEIVAGHDFVSCREVGDMGVHQSFLASSPRHPLVASVRALCFSNLRARRYGISDLDITGPKMFQRAFNRFVGAPELADVGVGDRRVACHRILMLQHAFAMHLKYWDVYIVDTRTRRRVIRTKFEGYEELMYGAGNVKYPDLWRQRRVFGEY